MRVLIVDDNHNFARFLFGSLATRGYEPRVVTSAVHALAAARESAPDLYLIDVLLPDGDGRELARAFITELGATPEQIVFMTAAERNVIGDTASLSTQPVFFKPFRLGGLLDLLRAHAAP